jgi:hypothetical protein
VGKDGANVGATKVIKGRSVIVFEALERSSVEEGCIRRE